MGSGKGGKSWVIRTDSREQLEAEADPIEGWACRDETMVIIMHVNLLYSAMVTHNTCARWQSKPPLKPRRIPTSCTMCTTCPKVGPLLINV
jgi:hypothetical protein